MVENKKMNECGICEESANNNFKCPNADIYYCNDCIKQFIESLNEKNNITGKILCPCGCKTQVNWKIPAEIEEEYEKFMDKHYEFRESIKYKASPENITFSGLINHINDMVFTQHCPNCKLAYTDFEGCASLSCNSCNEQFCPFCNTHGYPYDIHTHIEQCQFNILDKGTTYIPNENHKYIHSCIIFKKLLKILHKLPRKLIHRLIIHFKSELESYKIYQNNFNTNGFKTEDDMDQFIIEIMTKNLNIRHRQEIISDRPIHIFERYIPDEASQYIALYADGRIAPIPRILVEREARTNLQAMREEEAEREARALRNYVYPQNRRHRQPRNIKTLTRANIFREKEPSTLRSRMMRMRLKAKLQDF